MLVGTATHWVVKNSGKSLLTERQLTSVSLLGYLIMSGRSSGLAPLGSKKTGSSSPRGKTNKDDDFGNMLEDILDKPAKKNSQSDPLDNSFDSYNSTSLASESFPSPYTAKYQQQTKGRGSPTALLSAGKGATAGVRGSTAFNDSMDLDSSRDNLEESQNSSPGYVPGVRLVGTNAAVNAGVNKQASKTYGQSEDFDYNIDLPSGKAPSSKSGTGTSNATISNTDGDDGGGDLGGGFVPSIASKPRPRRQLQVSGAPINTGAAGATNIAASLDDLDNMLGFKSTVAAVATTSNVAFETGARSLREYESSDDEGLAKEQSRAPVSKKGDKIRKNLAVRIDTDSNSVAGTLDSQSSNTAASYRDYSSEGAYEPTASATPSRSLERGGKNAAGASPAWLGDSRSSSRSPKGSDRPNTALANTSAPSSNTDRTVWQLQRDAEATQLEREAVERQLRLEIDSLKSKLARTALTTGEKESGDSSAAGSRQLKETSDLRKQIAQQEIEMARLRDEQALTQLKHNEELKYITQRHSTELHDVLERKDQEIVVVEKRHSEALKALKAIHLEELDSLKARNKDNAVLDQLTQQLKSASGSIRLLEEQLLSKYRGLDAAKDGQMEARERLLADMEEKARIRADNAEAETYRLKGLLMHLEHVATSIRSQGGEEKERLRQEHQRLFTMQSSLESERSAFQARVADESANLKKRSEIIEAETQKLASERRQQHEAHASQQRALDADRSEFAAYVMAHTKQAEATTERLKDEETRLIRAKEELARDRAILEQRKTAAASDLQEAEELRSAVIAGREEVAREKVRLQQAVAELNAAATQLSQQGEALDKQAKVLEAKERSLRESQGHLRLAQATLKKKEQELVVGVKDLEARTLDLGGQDRDLMKRRMELAALQRELSSASAKASLDTHNITIVVSESERLDSSKPRQAWGEQNIKEASGKENSKGDSSQGTSDWTRSFRDRLAAGQSKGRVTENDRRINDELMESRKMLQAARSTLTRTSSTRLQAERMLSDEAKFLATLQAQRVKAKTGASLE